MHSILRRSKSNLISDYLFWYFHPFLKSNLECYTYHRKTEEPQPGNSFRGRFLSTPQNIKRHYKLHTQKQNYDMSEHEWQSIYNSGKHHILNMHDFCYLSAMNT